MTVKRDITKIIADFNDVPDGRNVQADLSVLAIGLLRDGIDIDAENEKLDASEILDILKLNPFPPRAEAYAVPAEFYYRRKEQFERYAETLFENVVDFALWAFDAAAHYQTIQLLNSPAEE